MVEHQDDSETVVVFTIRPRIDEPRWRALNAAALAAGAVRGDINPPTQLAALIALYADLERDSHLPLVDVPSGTNLDARLAQLAAIIEALRTP